MGIYKSEKWLLDGGNSIKLYQTESYCWVSKRNSLFSKGEGARETDFFSF